MSLRTQRLAVLVGLGGVDVAESPHARKVARLFEPVMVLVALWIPIELLLGWAGKIEPQAQQLSAWLVWGFFLVETLILSLLVHKRGRFLIQNWMNVLIIVVGFPLLWAVTPVAGMLRAVRLLVLVGEAAKLVRTFYHVLGQHALGGTLLVAFGVVFLFGILASIVDPGIETPVDGMWWALVTITTVGYGDIVPSNDAGRILGVALIVFGVALFSLLTASIAAFFLSPRVEAISEEESELQRTLKEMNHRMERIERELRELRARDSRREGGP